MVHIIEFNLIFQFDKVCQSKILLSLSCIRVEVLNQTRQEMSLVNCGSICQLVLDWTKRQSVEELLSFEQLVEKVLLVIFNCSE